MTHKNAATDRRVGLFCVYCDAWTALAASDLHLYTTIPLQYAPHIRPSPHRQDLSPKDKLGCGDSYLVTDLVPPAEAQDLFKRVLNEVQWDTMHHRGGDVPRLVAVQGEVLEDGGVPLYRHPADESPPLLAFTPTVELIREHVQREVGHPLNHALIQLYRSGADYISEHSDKTIDIVRGSKIANVSLGAERAMTLYLKKDAASGVPHVRGEPRPAQRFALPHNSVFIMGPETNARWQHAVKRDRRIPTTRTAAENAEDGVRISLTFRHIGTFLTPDGKHIFGQGATGKTRETAHAVSDNTIEAEALLLAFSDENHKSNFDWDQEYGKGFDVVDLHNV
ncbi:hypothetical protein FISHEDRAFT_65098 [Fistulina hepatica ATCC 64428]|uniref:Fe2OG dioxygenase domain-containing protein n=1 Tax=Fistulina hepatica ATCC 64428 TaxID=1128425 RepID=A0A0D7ADV8_9AGAR|nr:hypothetical protein FISHEDRAFT_65098 [Fistulina hepatica ATCC 64428]